MQLLTRKWKVRLAMLVCVGSLAFCHSLASTERMKLRQVAPQLDGCPRLEVKLSPGPKGGGKFKNPDLRVAVRQLGQSCRHGAGEYIRTIDKLNGRERYYEVHVPPGYDPAKPAAVVFVLHGGGGYPDAVRFVSDMDRVSDANGFITVYPAATSPFWLTYPREPWFGQRKYLTDRLLYWHNGLDLKDRDQVAIDDVKFISFIIDDLGNYFSIDRRRVHAIGISNGGLMAYELAARLPDRIASVGVVGAQRLAPKSKLPTSQPVSMITFNGMLDTWQIFDGGLSPVESWAVFTPHRIPPVYDALNSWRTHYSCGRMSGSGNGTATSEVLKCAGGTTIENWIIDDGGHTWPGGKVTPFEVVGGFTKHTVGPVSKAVDASAEAWRFFRDHPLKTG